MTDEVPSAARPSEWLRSQKARVLAVWEQRVRAVIPAASSASHPILVNTFPAILERLADVIDPESPRRTATEGSTLAEEHGGERVRLTRYRLEDVIVEYQLLRRVVLEVAEEKVPLSVASRDALNASMDEMVMKACSAFTLVQANFREQFFAVLAHDMRTPLAAARLSAGLILRKPESRDVVRWASRGIDNLDRVDRMLQDLLDAMRLEAGARLPLVLEACDLVELAKETLDQLESHAGERFRLKAPAPVRGYFAPEPLRRAIENLVANALKYGAESRQITISVTAVEGRAILEVHNFGAPIPPQEREGVFLAFQRARSAQRGAREGWGLGLAQVRGVAEAHGGSVSVESLPDLGTTFLIDIPQDARPFQEDPPPRD